MLTSPSVKRFVALDVHKHYVVAGAVTAGQQVVLAPRRVDLDDLPDWSQRHLRPTDAVVLEATTNAWHLCDQLRPLVASVTVAHPLLVKLITSARVKTDARDTLHLVRLLAAGLIPAVWIPTQDVRELRALVAHHTRLIRQRTQAKNRLRSTLHRYNIVPPDGGLFAAAQRSWWEALPLSAVEKLRIRQDLSVLASLEPLIAEVEVELTRLSAAEPWLSQVVFLLQVPGIGVINALVLLAAIGDISRFPTAKHLVCYAGLGASVHASGQTYQTGHITRQGRKEMRAALVESAWMAVEHHPYWNAYVERYHRTYGQECLHIHRPSTLQEVREVTEAFLQHYNNERPHQGRSRGNVPPRVAFPTLPTLPALPERIDPDAWLATLDQKMYLRHVGRDGCVEIDLATYYIGPQMAGRAVLLQVIAENRQFAVWHQDQVVKLLPIKGLVGSEMALDEYVKYIQQEALAAPRRSSARGSRKVRQPSLWGEGA